MFLYSIGGNKTYAFCLKFTILL